MLVPLYDSVINSLSSKEPFQWVRGSRITDIMPYSIEEVNQFSPQEFQEKFKNVVECRPEAGLFASMLLPFRNGEMVVLAFHHYLDQLPVETKRQILQIHPELGEANFNSLTDDSKLEQKSAGMDKFDEFDITTFNQLKAAYRNKFGFPFVICVRENTRESIIKALNRRLENSTDEELTNGIAEVKKICKIRVLDLVN